SCEVCGRGPAQRLRFRQVIGMIVVDRVRSIDAPLCKECAQRVGRSLQANTLVTGWWGVFAIFRNLGAICANTAALSRAAKMPQPQGGPISFVKERPIFTRPQTWIGLVLLGSLITVAAIAAASAEDTPSRIGANDRGNSS